VRGTPSCRSPAPPPAPDGAPHAAPEKPSRRRAVQPRSV